MRRLPKALPFARIAAARIFRGSASRQHCWRHARLAPPCVRELASLAGASGRLNCVGSCFVHFELVVAGAREKEYRAYGSCPPFDVGDQGDGPVTVDYSSLVSEREFHKRADEVLNHLQEQFEEQGDKLAIDGFDTDYSDGVLTLRLGSLGTYVINKQTPNRQIWLSSPVSGPARFDWNESDEAWVYRRTKAELLSLLENELSKLLKAEIPLKQA